MNSSTVSNLWADWEMLCGQWLFGGTVILLLAGSLAMLLRTSSAAVRHRVWALGLSALLVFPAAIASLPGLAVIRWPDAVKPQSHRAAENPVVRQIPMARSAAEPGAIPPRIIAADEHPAEVRSMTGNVFPSPVVAPEPVTEPTPVPESMTRNQPPVAVLNAGWSWSVVWTTACACWLAGMLAGLMLTLRSHWLARGVVRRGTQITEPSLVELSEDLGAEMGLRHRVSLRCSAELHVPQVTGLWRPVVLLPAGYGRWDADRTRVALAHEIAHIARRDLWWQLVSQLAVCLFWVQPLVWLAAWRLRVERERACDDAVLELGERPAQYATHLVELAAELKNRQPAYSAAVAMAARSQVEDRVVEILDQTKSRRPVSQLAGLALGLVIALAVVGTGLLRPVANAQADTVDKKPEPVRESQPAPSQKLAQEPAKLHPALDPKGIFGPPSAEGRLTDETGAPVTEATISASGTGGGRAITANVDADGNFRLPAVADEGEYQIWIRSTAWIGTDYRARLTVKLAPGQTVKRDFQLQRACRVMVRVLDEEQKPVSGVQVLIASASADVSSGDSMPTNAEGMALIGGVAPSGNEYLIGTMHKDYGFARLNVKLTDPGEIVVHDVILPKGEEVTGSILCSDGLPPAGWRISALPAWWKFGRFPMGELISNDGTFTLRHVTSERYNVSVSIPLGDQASTSRSVLQNSELTTGKPLTLKLDYPSPASLDYISGRIEYAGSPPMKGFWLDAGAASNTVIRPGQLEFKLGPMPKVPVRISISDTEVEMEEVQVTPPAKDVVIRVTAKGRPHLAGTLVGSDGQPVSKFRLRVMKVQTLSGPNFQENPEWREFTSATGTFDTALTGPGVYRVLATADGYASTLSEDINTQSSPGKPVLIRLTAGVTLTGMILDEAGNGVNGAQIFPLHKYAQHPSSLQGRAVTLEGAVRSSQGQFELKHLSVGQEMLHIKHPDFSPLTATVEVRAEPGEPIKLVVKRGATVRGIVYDADGQPEPGVSLHAFGGEGDFYSFGGEEPAAVTVSNAEGAYELSHLAEGGYSIRRSDVWETAGVVAHTIQVKNGNVHRLHFGGPVPFTGRLLLNDVPLANRRVVLGGDQSHSMNYRAITVTDEDGRFTLHGVAPGRRGLHCQAPGPQSDFISFGMFEISTAGGRLPDLNLRTGQVTLTLAPGSMEVSPRDYIRMYLWNPDWSAGNAVGKVSPRTAPTDSILIQDVPLGEYDFVISPVREGNTRVSYHRKISLTADQSRPAYTLDLPPGTATLRGKVSGVDPDPNKRPSFILWNKDQTLSLVISTGPTGEFEASRLPAGQYQLRVGHMRSTPIFAEFSLANGETKELPLTLEQVQAHDPGRGFMSVTAYTNEGVPLPMVLRLEGPNGLVEPTSTQGGRNSIRGPIGRYTLIAAFPGFETVQQDVDLRAALPGGSVPPESIIQVTLNPLP